MISDRVHQAFRLDEIEGRYDRVLFYSAVLLAGMGLLMVASSSIAVAEGHGVGPFYFLLRHAMFLAGGGLLALALARTELKLIERHSRSLLIAGFALLVLVFVPVLGRSVNGAQRWISLGVSNFQVVEAVKLILIIWLASYLARHRDQVQTRWFGALKPLLVAAVMVALLLAQPDFGSAMLICAITAGMIWLGGVRVVHVAAPLLAAAPVLAWAAMSESYRVRRLTSFMNPWEDPFKDGFQLTQALIAIGRGEWLGVGIGGSIQKLYYLPEAHTDFIFAVIAEETGLVGIMLLIAVFVTLCGRAFWLGLRGVEMGRAFAGFCAFGVGLWLSLQALVSVGVNLGLLPTKGLTLPLISSGGSSVLMTCAAIGLLLRVSYELDRTRKVVARLRSEPGRAGAGGDVGGEADPAGAPLPERAALLRRRVEPSLGALQ
jgi:cell division protein FtsW